MEHVLDVISPVNMFFFASDEVMVFCLRLFLLVRETLSMCIHEHIWYFPYLTTQQGVYTHVFVGGVHSQTGVCLRWLFTFYHGKSPVNHHLGNYVLLFWSIILAQFVTIFNSSYWASSAFVRMGLVEPKDEQMIKKSTCYPGRPNSSWGSAF